MKVGEIMKKDLVTIDKDDNLRDAIKLMKKHDVSRLVVRDKGKIIGILTERDVSDRLGRLETTPISDAHVHVSAAYTDKLITIGMDADLKEAAKRMLENKISSLVVANGYGDISGIVTKSDVIRSLEDSKLPVSDYMSRKTVNLKMGSSLLNARKLMMEAGVNRVLVTFDEEVVGVITESDVANFLGMFRKMSKGVQWFNKLKTLNVEDIMSKDVATIGENAVLGDATRLMKENDISGIPVVDAHGKLSGIITKTDLLKAISK